MWELSNTFYFEAAHTLERYRDTESSRRVHGHSYRAVVTLRGEPDPETGMIMDMADFRDTLEDVRKTLDHQLLDEVEGLGPATMENLSAFIWRHVEPLCPNIAQVGVYRDTVGDSCVYHGPSSGAA